MYTTGQLLKLNYIKVQNKDNQTFCQEASSLCHTFMWVSFPVNSQHIELRLGLFHLKNKGGWVGKKIKILF